MLDYSKSFIEVQFPVSKISKESYKERKANLGQTLTGLGKWWGRKPLVLVRATLIGILMPVSDNPSKDRDIFLKIMTMDEDGLLFRKSKNIPIKILYTLLNPIERNRYFDSSSTESSPKLIREISMEDRDYLQRIVFNRMSYDEKLEYCLRPEQVKLENKESWNEINEHLETNAFSIQDLVQQLGMRRFGNIPRVGDCFSGGGSIPFEAARIGADVFASDLNPIATVLTWASLNIAGLGDKDIIKLKNFQDEIYREVDRQIKEWGIEENEKGHRADSYLYCHEAICPECGYKVPLAPSWIIGKGTNTVALLVDNGIDGFEIDVKMDGESSDFELCEKMITIRGSNLFCPHCKKETPISSIRGDYRSSSGLVSNNLRLWNINDFMPMPKDIFQERLYAIRYVSKEGRYYTSPTEEDLLREKKVVELLRDRFEEWQLKGYIPSSKIEFGDKTDEPIRTRGWTHWHHLFNPRQLLINGLFSRVSQSKSTKDLQKRFVILGINKIVDYNSKLCVWHSGGHVENGQNTFLNQALNTIYNYSTRGIVNLYNSWKFNINNNHISNNNFKIVVKDAREIKSINDIWITDPPYADAVNYHELTEFFLAWDIHLLRNSFPDWYTDSKRTLAVKGTGDKFNRSMIEIYSNLANNMTDEGYQVVMFTHQDVKVWSELAMVLWSAGLQVVSAWNIATETESGGLKGGGNYVKGTVLLTLRKQTSTEMAFTDDLLEEIKFEVKSIIDSMKDIDDKDEPDFNDADYLLASYAASLKVVTKYKEIYGIDVNYWLSQSRDNTKENPVEELINKAVRIAYDYLIPESFEKGHWADLKPEERFYIRGLELEINNANKVSSYQELARGFGVTDYKDLFENFKANQARLKTPSEFRMTQIGTPGFGSTLLRHILAAINETTVNKSTESGRSLLRNAFKEDNQYWFRKPLMIEILSYIANLEFNSHMSHWHENAHSAKILKEALKNDGV